MRIGRAVISGFLAIALASPLQSHTVHAMEAEGQAVQEEPARLSDEEVDAMAAVVESVTGCDRYILKAIAYRESGFHPDARNGSHIGIMQINPRWFGGIAESLSIEPTAEAFQIPYQNMLLAGQYLANLQKKYTLEKALTLYSEGVTNNSTSHYARAIIRDAEQYRKEK